MFIKCKTDKGMTRSNNQDYVLSFRSSKYTLLVVADGMGGHKGGEIASKLAATTIRNFIFDQTPKNQQNNQIYDTSSQTDLENIIQLTNCE